MERENWIDKISVHLDGVKLTRASLENMKTLEWLIEGGKARVLACIVKSGKRGMRYTELLKMTDLPNTNLNRILTELRKNDIIIRENMDVEEPRKSRVSMYYYNKKFGPYFQNIFNSLIAMSRDDVKEIRELMVR